METTGSIYLSYTDTALYYINKASWCISVMYYLPVIGDLGDIPLGSTSFTTCGISTLPGDDTIVQVHPGLARSIARMYDLI